MKALNFCSTKQNKYYFRACKFKLSFLTILEIGGLSNDAVSVMRGVKHHLKNWVTYGQVFLSSGKVFQLSFDDIFFFLNVARSILLKVS
jgi:hypothetical protein